MTAARVVYYGLDLAGHAIERPGGRWEAHTAGGRIVGTYPGHVPPAGTMLVGTYGGVEALVVPAARAPGCYYLSRIDPDPEGGATAHGLRKPMRARGVATVLTGFLEFPADRAEWAVQNCGKRTAYNAILNDSPEQYVTPYPAETWF